MIRAPLAMASDEVMAGGEENGLNGDLWNRMMALAVACGVDTFAVSLGAFSIHAQEPSG